MYTHIIDPLKKQANHDSLHINTLMKFWKAQRYIKHMCHHKAGRQFAHFLFWYYSSHWRKHSSLPSALHDLFPTILKTAPQVSSGNHFSPTNEGTKV